MSVTRFQKNFNNTMPFSNTCYQLLLAASTEQHFTVPGTENQIYRAEFRCQTGAEVYVRLNGTAAIPGAGMQTALSNQELLPLIESRYVKGGDTLSFISAATPNVSVSLLQVQDIT